MNKEIREVNISMIKVIGIIGLLLFLVGFNWFLIIHNVPVYTYLMIYGFLLMLWFAISFMIDGMGIRGNIPNKPTFVTKRR